MAKTSATHQGHCQLCGNLQKLPGSTLSLHGYNVLQGFFSGVCSGARHLPFELSKDLIEDAIVRAQKALQGVEAEQAALRQEPADGVATAWQHVYVGFQGKGRSSYSWRQVEVVETVKTYRDGSEIYSTFSYSSPLADGRVKEHEISLYCQRKTLKQVVWESNQARAKWMEHQAKSLRLYISWQQERVASWKPAPEQLIAVDVKVKDTQRFEPVEAPY